MTRAQALTMLCRLAGIDTGTFATANTWYSGVENWSVRAGVIPVGTNVSAAATREEIAQYITAIYRLKPSETQTGFADTASVYANTLKDYGISIGYLDDQGRICFGGEQNVKRCDLCLMLSRLKTAAEQPDWSRLTPPSVSQDQAVTYAARLVKKPEGWEDVAATMRYLMTHGMTSHTFTVEAGEGSYFTKDSANQWIDWMTKAVRYGYNSAARDCMHYSSFYNAYNAEYVQTTQNGKIIKISYTVKLKVRGSASALRREISAVEQECDTIIRQMYAIGTLRSTMTGKEKAWELYKYVDQRLVYDLGMAGTDLYQVLQSNRGVCEGYTALYTALCHRVGIPMQCVYSKDHVWNVIRENGTDYYTDVTWGDSNPNDPDFCNPNFFWISGSRLLQLDPGREIIDGPVL
ncbi:MAG: transglutaminase domain-containing protein [Bacillota bacterium]|nr:transglutaminase domain-containing protein [Bacillota bacterium]